MEFSSLLEVLRRALFILACRGRCCWLHKGLKVYVSVWDNGHTSDLFLYLRKQFPSMFWLDDAPPSQPITITSGSYKPEMAITRHPAIYTHTEQAFILTIWNHESASVMHSTFWFILHRKLSCALWINYLHLFNIHKNQPPRPSAQVMH